MVNNVQQIKGSYSDLEEFAFNKKQNEDNDDEFSMQDDVDDVQDLLDNSLLNTSLDLKAGSYVINSSRFMKHTFWEFPTQTHDYDQIQPTPTDMHSWQHAPNNNMNEESDVSADNNHGHSSSVTVTKETWFQTDLPTRAWLLSKATGQDNFPNYDTLPNRRTSH